MAGSNATSAWPVAHLAASRAHGVPVLWSALRHLADCEPSCRLKVTPWGARAAAARWLPTACAPNYRARLCIAQPSPTRRAAEHLIAYWAKRPHRAESGLGRGHDLLAQSGRGRTLPGQLAGCVVTPGRRLGAAGAVLMNCAKQCPKTCASIPGRPTGHDAKRSQGVRAGTVGDLTCHADRQPPR